MKPGPFEFIAPDTMEGALSALNQHGHDAKLLAGGQSLIPAMNFRMMSPAVLIDLNRIEELDYIEETDSGGLKIGAMTRQRTVERSDLVSARAPLLFETMPHIAHLQIRSRGTIGGSLAHADPAAELPVVALALDAQLHIQGPEGKRTIAADDFFQFLFTTDLAHNEILTGIELPPLPERTGWAFEEFARRKGDYAIAGVAAWITVNEAGTCTDARLVYLNLADVPLSGEKARDALIGRAPDEAAFKDAAGEAAGEVRPEGNVHASPEYQRHLAGVLTQRALARAAARLNGSQNHG